MVFYIFTKMVFRFRSLRWIETERKTGAEEERERDPQGEKEIPIS